MGEILKGWKILGSFFVLSVLLTFVIANDSNPHTLYRNHTGVNTSNGQIDLPKEMMIDGSPINYITLSEDTEIEVFEGNMTFLNGTKLDCAPLFYESDPCNLIYELSRDHAGVNTSNGQISLTKTTLIGGFPINYITLSEDTVIETVEEGNKTFENGTKINCDPTANLTDPCSNSPFELARNHTGVNTSNGLINLTKTTLIGGSPLNYITLIEEAVIETVEEGNRTFYNGTKINCDPTMFEPDPCGLIYELSRNHTGVNTSNGQIYLTKTTLIGGYPANYITLTEETVIETVEEGNKTFYNGTRINCDPTGNLTDPCSNSFYELSRNHTGVNTSNGLINLTKTVLISGSPLNYITLIEETVIETVEEGNKTFQIGTKINCDPAMFEPDPCNILYELSRDHTGVNTSNGQIYLLKEIIVGGYPINHITLTENTVIETVEEGNKTFDSGTYIDCDPTANVTNPCEPSYELALNHTGVSTSNGQINLTIGTLVSDFLIFFNYITLNETIILKTIEEGNKTFDSGAYIDCEPQPGEPDPCGLS